MKTENFDYLIGKSVKGLKKPKGYTVRVVKEDGVWYMVTMDFRTDRINVIVENGIITEIDGIG